MHHFVAIGEFKLELQSGNAQSRSNSTTFRAVWPWNLTDDLERQWGTSSKQHQAIRIISSSYLNSNWSYSPETAKLGCDLCDLDLWPLTLTFCMDLTLVIGNNKVWQTDGRTDGQTDGQTENTICRAAWSQLKNRKKVCSCSRVKKILPLFFTTMVIINGSGNDSSKISKTNIWTIDYEYQ